MVFFRDFLRFLGLTCNFSESERDIFHIPGNNPRVYEWHNRSYMHGSRSGPLLLLALEAGNVFPHE